MNRYTIAVLVRNQFGVLNRVTSMFRRRQFNISALTVSETESNELSRITVVFDGEEVKKQQLVNQLYKLPDVEFIEEFTDDDSISCELLLIKMVNEPDTREEIRAAASAFGADTVDYAKDSPHRRLFELHAGLHHPGNLPHRLRLAAQGQHHHSSGHQFLMRFIQFHSMKEKE